MSRVFMTGLEMGGDGNAPEVFTAYYQSEISISEPRTGIYCLRTDGDNPNTYAYINFPDDADDEIYVRAYIKYTSGMVMTVEILKMCDEAGNPHVHFLADGSVETWNGAAWVNVGDFGAITTSYVRWEFYVKIHDTAGLIQVRQDGVEVLNLSGIDTWGGNVGTDPWVARVFFGNNSATDPGSSKYLRYDDLAINNTVGSVNDSWPGPGAILVVYPTGVGFYEDFIPTPGTGEQNYEDVDEIPHDTADYVEAAVLADRDTYEMLNLPGISEVSQVKAVSWLAYAKIFLGGDGKIKPLFRFSAYLWDGDDFPDVGIDWDYIMHIEDENPVLGTAWIADDINSNQFGFQEAS